MFKVILQPLMLIESTFEIILSYRVKLFSFLVSPKFLKELSDADVPAQQPCSLVAEVTGNPKPELMWYFTTLLSV